MPERSGPPPASAEGTETNEREQNGCFGGTGGAIAKGPAADRQPNRRDVNGVSEPTINVFISE